jgi:hypothetical protein
MTERPIPTLLLILMALCSHLSARTLPSLDLPREVTEADFILEGTHTGDGMLAVTKLHKGILPLPAKCRVAGGASWFDSVLKVSGSDAAESWIAFVRKPSDNGEYALTASGAALVMLSKSQKVYAQLPALNYGGSTIAAHSSWDRTTFERELARAIGQSGTLTQLLSLPRGAEKAEQLIEFVRSAVGWPPEKSDLSPTLHGNFGYPFYRAANGLREPAEAEVEILAGHIRQTESDQGRSLLLALVAAIKPPASMFEVVKPWVERSTPSLSRGQAISALIACDPYEAAGVLSKYLNIKDPHLDILTSALASGGWSRESTVHHPAIIDPLIELGSEALKQSKRGGQHEVNRGYAVLGLIQSYIHPRLLPLLVQWATASETSTSSQAKSNLRAVLGVENEAMTDQAVIAWWIANEEVTRQVFDLSTPPGLASWLTRWSDNANPMTRRVLFWNWDFLHTVPEKELLARCSGANSEAAKQALAELWQHKRLSAHIRKEIVRKFIKMKIMMERSRYNKSDLPGEVRVVAERRFPFPDGAWINCTGDLAANREPKIHDPLSGGSWSLHGKDVMGFYSTSGTGDPSVKAVVEVWEMDYEVSPPRELWRLRWNLAQTYKQPAIEVEAEADGVHGDTMK